jgi:hypothetical protein
MTIFATAAGWTAKPGQMVGMMVGQRWRGFMVAESMKTTDADRVRALLARLGMSQREGALELDMRSRDMRGYCAGEKVPRYVLLALERLVQIKEDGKWIA